MTPPDHFWRLCGLRPLRGVVFPIFATDLDVASSSGDPTFDWSALREPPLAFSALPWPSLAFLGLVYRRLSGLRWSSLVLPGRPSPPS